MQIIACNQNLLPYIMYTRKYLNLFQMSIKLILKFLECYQNLQNCKGGPVNSNAHSRRFVAFRQLKMIILSRE
jgi:hypothetical protein